MKKFLVIILALTFVLGMSGVTFAEDGPTDMSSVPITKLFKITNAGTISPAETFTFKIERESYSDSLYADLSAVPLPYFDSVENPQTGSISFAQGTATIAGVPGSATLQLPNYDHVGYYTYKITEIPGNTAGVNYDGRTFYLTVTVINNGDSLIRQVTSLYYFASGNVKQKVQKFENTFSAGNLAITKEVTGNLGQKDRYFSVTVTLTAPTGSSINTVPVTFSGGKYTTTPVTFEAGVAKETFEIKHGDTITFNNLPYGVKYDVVETAPGDDYAAPAYDYSDPVHMIDNNVVADSNEDTVKITNNKTKQVETGINLDSLPYIIILVAAAGGLVLFMRRRISDHH